MMRFRWIRAAGVAVLVFGVANCGSDEEATAPPTAEQLAATLVNVDDYQGEWTVNLGPEGSTEMTTGVVPEDLQDLLPGFELCDEASADARAAADAMRWMAFRQLDLAVDDPIQPPDRTGHMVFVQEFLTAEDADEVTATFDLLSEGMQACLGEVAIEDEGPSTAAEMTLPDLGDDRFGVLLTVEEAGGNAEWRIHSALVRQGPVLALIQVVDIRAGEGVEPYYSIDDVGAMMQTAVDRL